MYGVCVMYIDVCVVYNVYVYVCGVCNVYIYIYVTMYVYKSHFCASLMCVLAVRPKCAS